MVIYDGSTFEVTKDFKVMFPRMEEGKERWMMNYSVLVDCMYVALSSEGIVGK